MKPRCLAVALAVWVGLAPAAAWADGAPGTPTGRWQGGGRACHGTLAITPRRLSWNTPFSRCLALPYRAEAGELGSTRLRLLRRNAGCRFAVVELRRHDRGTGNAPSWEALGLPPGAPAAQALACPLVRLK